MRKNLKLLGELQGIDLKIDVLHGEKDALLGEIAALEDNVTIARNAIDEKNGQAEELETAKKSLEENLATEAENIVRSEARLKEIKTQKEYQAVSKEISSAKKLTSELEEQILQKTAQLEELQAQIAEKEENLKSLEANISAQQGEVQSKVDKLESDIAIGIAAKDATVKSLPASMVKRYQKLRDQRKGIAVVEAKDGCCLGCNMNLPPQVYNLLFRGEEIITCPHCQRVLLLHQEPNNN
ncbi:protein of unknown function DUF164 [Geotalea daltonii FRC-32]|uniref:Uncharacterized protein n=1 Tax=Geotalea daltonii (strain DSM 22248 / JCM 15807 / FRC-32) TaxID=316067 RepID=B9M160_GEODF|nr:C4-type zinc ribbon domain-containing protein [Geotalea daltonii]ACM19130.1 protein of unknown function DUF164 [Geotalea daltonii FRC-32]